MKVEILNYTPANVFTLKHSYKQKIEQAVLVSSLMDYFLSSFFKLTNNLE